MNTQMVGLLAVVGAFGLLSAALNKLNILNALKEYRTICELAAHYFNQGYDRSLIYGARPQNKKFC